MRRKPTPIGQYRPLCSQENINGGLCSHRSSWTRIERNGEREFYCTRHANYYGVKPRRKGTRIA